MDPSDLELVRGVRATPALFNPMNADFKFAHRKEKIWTDLASYLGINMNDARRRWTCLRDRYSRELKARRLNPKTEYGPDEFFKEMDFLRPFVRKRKERRSIVCRIKSDTCWDGKMEKHSYDTSDSYSNKIETTTSTTEEVNVDEMYREYEEEKVGTMTIVMDSRNALTEEEPLLSEETYEEYQLQCSSEHSPTNPTAQNCEIVTVGGEETQRINGLTKPTISNETEDDFFCKSICAYLRQLSRVHKIKAKVEMFQILEKYIEIEES